MSIFPDRYGPYITVLANYAQTWAEDPGAIGLSEELSAEVVGAAASVREAYLAALEARATAAAATERLRRELRESRTTANTAIDAIRLYARTTGNASVYTAAKVPPPDGPSPLPAPGTPVYTGCELDQSGALTIRWTCKQPRGSRNVTYLVQRRTPGRPWQFLGATGVKRFTDDTLPAGSPWAEYTITARRGSSQGKDCLRRVNLGAVSHASVTSGSPAPAPVARAAA